MKRIRIADFINPEDDFFTLPFETDIDGQSGGSLPGSVNPYRQSCGDLMDINLCRQSGGDLMELNLCRQSDNDLMELNLCRQSGGARWGMTLCKAGSMRFRWNETNPNRQNNFSKIISDRDHTVVPVQLDHTKIVYDIKTAEDTKEKIGDGIITKNPHLVPTITIADCMPIFLYDPVTEVFGIVHSGWKGTGIVQEAIKLAEKNYGSKPKDFQIVLGPHIHDCCYIVDKERADYFAENFTPECIEPLELSSISKGGSTGKKLPSFVWNNGNGPLFRLSLEKANLSVLEKAGILSKNITVCEDCTACTNGDIFGSNRRETASNGKDNFTVMAGFVIKKS
ncbi:MAG: polyphenol oxidase family protein [Treponema sp.]|nr:polyphenol oxidase family protein [Treponema sp.]